VTNKFLFFFLHFYDDQKEKNALKFNAVLQNGYALKLLFFDKKERMKEFNFKPGETFNDSVIAEA